MLTTVQARKQAYGMGDPPLLREEDGTTDAFVEGLEVTQHSYRMHKTVFGPMTSIEAVCHDDWSGEVFEWRWKDDLNPEFLADSMPSVAEVRLSVNSFVNGLERQSTEPETTFSAQRVALWTYEALGRQPPEALLRIADAPAEAQALGRLFVFTCRVRPPPPLGHDVLTKVDGAWVIGEETSCAEALRIIAEGQGGVGQAFFRGVPARTSFPPDHALRYLRTSGAPRIFHSPHAAVNEVDALARNMNSMLVGAAVDIHDRVDPEASDEELAVIERDMMAVAVDFDDRGNEIEDDPALARSRTTPPTWTWTPPTPITRTSGLSVVCSVSNSIVSRAGFRVLLVL
jgi:hypothetical protein